ncbi:hypothetical protein CV102_11950 [Natronococcus pandeyae]|uniref:Uncharacterized protein n=1 Tax=Natronococcus pandeyae TaxID=2055836 RepID=A0A8J8Q4N4_9EURY|nr:hypothetical protein [Natronococcus pandeyae]TYL38508.1 hypothetical protein CV102_11950 [Natronococcus pandeyae]
MTTLTDADESESEESDESNPLEETPVSSGDPVSVLAALSVAFSWYLFYLKEDKTAGLFVGLWAPTLLGAAAYFQQKELYAMLENGLTFN